MLVNNIIINGIKSITPSTIQSLGLREWFGRAITYISANRTEVAVISSIAPSDKQSPNHPANSDASRPVRRRRF